MESEFIMKPLTDHFTTWWLFKEIWILLFIKYWLLFSLNS